MPTRLSNPAMPVIDSRRLTGPSLLLDRPGAVLEARVEPSQVKAAVDAWEQAARQLLQAVGWPDEQLASPGSSSGATRGRPSPIEGPYAAPGPSGGARGGATGALGGEKQLGIRKEPAALL